VKNPIFGVVGRCVWVALAVWAVFALPLVLAVWLVVVGADSIWCFLWGQKS